MSRRPVFNLRLPTWHEWLIYLVTVSLYLTGVAWLVLGNFGAVQGDFGPEPHPALPWLLAVHGVLAYVFVIACAMLFTAHVRLGWYAKRNRSSGSILVGIGIILTATGLLLYYATAEGLRLVSSMAHWLIGLALPLALSVHIVCGKRTRSSG